MLRVAWASSQASARPDWGARSHEGWTVSALFRRRRVQHLTRRRRSQRRRKGGVAGQRKQENCHDDVCDGEGWTHRNADGLTVHEAEERQYRARERKSRGIDELLVNDEGADRRQHEAGKNGAATHCFETRVQHAHVREVAKSE